jgi:hypothetical protein
VGLALPFAAFAARFSRRSVAVSVLTFGLVGLLGASYRLTSALACIGWIMLFTWWKTRVVFWAGATLVVLLALAPVDVTLRGRPGPARVVPTTSGCLTKESARLDEQGDLAIVGGCDPAYLEPGWVMVW